MKKYSLKYAPIVKGEKLNKLQCSRNEIEREELRSIPYASIVRSLNYTQICIRPDIAFAMSMLGHCQHDSEIEY